MNLPTVYIYRLLWWTEEEEEEEAASAHWFNQREAEDDTLPPVHFKISFRACHFIFVATRVTTVPGQFVLLSMLKEWKKDDS